MQVVAYTVRHHAVNVSKKIQALST